jgi:cAMP-dependent protein kinase regulator
LFIVTLITLYRFLVIGDLMVKPSDRPVNDIRRVSVSAESVDPAHLRQQRSQLLVSEKSPDVTVRLLGVVSKSPLLRTLDEEQRDILVRAFTGPIMKEAGETIIQQGDIGDVFYLLEDGLVNVFVQKKGEDSKQVHTYKGGDAFGELAIMYNAPRAATCVAQDDCKLWALDRHSYRSIVIDAAMQKRETYCGFLSRVPILQTLTEMEVMTLADALREEKYSDGETVCYQGDDGDYFYIIKDGTAVCLQVDVDGDEKMVAKLHEGNYFGGMNILKI